MPIGQPRDRYRVDGDHPAPQVARIHRAGRGCLGRHRQAGGGPGDRVALVTRGQLRQGRTEIHGHLLGVAHVGDHRDGLRRHLAGRDCERGRAAREGAVGNDHRQRQGERRPGRRHRAHPGRPDLLEGNDQRQGAVVLLQSELIQRRQAGEHAGGKLIQAVVVQPEPRQRRQAGEHARGKLVEAVAFQAEKPQIRQPGEHTRGKRREFAPLQIELIQRREPGEHIRGKRSELVFVQRQQVQGRQAGEHVLREAP